MPRKPPSVLGACFLPLVAALILAAALLIGLALSIPGQAENLFGPASPNLTASQHFWLSAMLLWQEDDLTTPANPYGAPQTFAIELGEPASSIIQRLGQEGLVGNPAAFRSYLQYKGLDTSIQAGDYTLSTAMTPVEMAVALQDATPATVAFHVLPGWRMEEIARLLPTSGLSITPEDFLAAARARPEGFSFSADLPEGASLEGFLFPDGYDLPRDLDAPALVGALLGRFDSQVTNDIREGFAAQGLSLYEGVTLASIVQREAVIDDEMPLIASVFLNRLAIGMKLDSDPTVQYALGYDVSRQTWWTNPLSLADMQVESPYNTYLYAGFPPSPICSPGLAALRAVAFPAQSPYYYFRAACDHSGRHVFAQTFEEHLSNACP